jgi:hypothetical protein
VRSTKQNYFFVGSIVLLLLLLGYFRDFMFININFLMGVKYYVGIETDYVLPAQLSLLDKLSYDQLYYGKFILTLFFAILFFLISLFTIRRVFGKEKKYTRWTLYAYAGIFATSALFYLYAMITNDYENGYKLSRAFMGFLQSPFVLMVLVPAFKMGQNK